MANRGTLSQPRPLKAQYVNFPSRNPSRKSLSRMSFLCCLEIKVDDVRWNDLWNMFDDASKTNSTKNSVTISASQTGCGPLEFANLQCYSSISAVQYFTELLFRIPLTASSLSVSALGSLRIAEILKDYKLVLLSLVWDLKNYYFASLFRSGVHWMLHAAGCCCDVIGWNFGLIPLDDIMLWSHWMTAHCLDALSLDQSASAATMLITFCYFPLNCHPFSVSNQIIYFLSLLSSKWPTIGKWLHPQKQGDISWKVWYASRTPKDANTTNSMFKERRRTFCLFRCIEKIQNSDSCFLYIDKRCSSFILWFLFIGWN